MQALREAGMLSSARSDSRSSPRLQALLSPGRLVFPRCFCSHPQAHGGGVTVRATCHTSIPRLCSVSRGVTRRGCTFPTKFLQTPLGLSNTAAKKQFTCSHRVEMFVCSPKGEPCCREGTLRFCKRICATTLPKSAPVKASLLLF